jgi:hypothetical protein
MANGDPCEPDAPYRLVERTAASATPVRSTAAGQLWVYFGSDSGFEGTTTFFIDHVRLTLTPR